MGVTGAATLLGAVIVDDTVSITGAVDLASTLDVTGASTLLGAVIIDDTVSITGAVDVTGAIVGSTTIANQTGTLGDSEATQSALVATAGIATDANYIGAIHHDVITFTNVTDTFTNGVANGQSQIVCTFPVGRILILGAAVDLTLDITTNVWEDTGDDVFLISMGTAAAAAAEATLTGTEADIIVSTELDTVAAGGDGGSVFQFQIELDMTAGGDSVFDGTSSAVSLYFNGACADASISGNATYIVTGAASVTWAWLGTD